MSGQQNVAGDFVYRVYTARYDQVVPAKTFVYHRPELSERAVETSKFISYPDLMAYKRQLDDNLRQNKEIRSRIGKCIIHGLAENGFSPRDTVTTLLVDNSGSLRGNPAKILIPTIYNLGEMFHEIGMPFAVLGFTTVAWKGGQPRQDWIKAGKPDNPGRLNALRHIVYKDFDQSWGQTKRYVALMMAGTVDEHDARDAMPGSSLYRQRGFFKENVDGEAVLWAAEHMITKRAEKNRLLLVASDEGPVDDSTLAVAPSRSNFLSRHLEEVVAEIVRHDEVRLSSLRLHKDGEKPAPYERAESYYPHSINIDPRGYDHPLEKILAGAGGLVQHLTQN